MPYPPLSRVTVVEAAIAYVDARGLHDLTMRQLGASLGVEAMALYRYVPSREGLMDAIVEHVVDDLYEDRDVHMEDSDAGWEEYLARLAHGVRRMALAHPYLFPVVATRPPAAPWIRPPLRSLRLVESFLDNLLARGFSPGAAADAYRAFSSFLLGHLLLEVSTHGAVVGPEESGGPEDVAAAQAHLDASLRGHPTLLAMQEDLTRDHAEAEFEESLENLLDRLRHTLRP